MIIHHLDGCAPTPLAHYLKALGILRLVSEQADPEARGWWEGDRFVLATTLDREALLHFFADSYQPTPAVAPWNKGSGFFYDKDPALRAPEQSTALRFEKLRIGIVAARTLLLQIAEADQTVRSIKAESKAKELTKAQRDMLRASEEYRARLAAAERRFKSLKIELIPNLRLTWRGAHREWLDAAVVIEEGGVARYPAMLGTGGNDGRLDFTNNYFQRLTEMFDFQSPEGDARPAARAWFDQALFGQPARVLNAGVPAGQFAPGHGGGANATTGPEGSSRLNPVDFVLAIEGAVLFASAVTRRLDSHNAARAVAPFAIGGRGSGYASSAESDESARGEQWVPIWSQPATLIDLRRLLSEGRSQLGPRNASEPLDLARAVRRLGTARGISSFCRYAYIERNGQSNLAVPLGRFFVHEDSSALLSNLDDLDRWLARLRREARSKAAPARLAKAEHQLTDALFTVTSDSASPGRWQSTLLKLADIEAVQVSGSGFEAGPIPPLRPEWVAAADDGSPEFRLAVALALQWTSKGLGVRIHWIPMKGRGYDTVGSGAQTRLRIGPSCVMQGRSGIDDAIALLDRLIIEAARRGERAVDFRPASRASASIADLAGFVNGEVDADRTLQLARALMAVDSRSWEASTVRLKRAAGEGHPDDGWLAIRLTLLPHALPDGRHPHFDPAILRRLAAGDPVTAVELARRCLRSAGINASIRSAMVPPGTTRLWAAALAFPISAKTAVAFARLLDPQSMNKERAS